MSACFILSVQFYSSVERADEPRVLTPDANHKKKIEFTCPCGIRKSLSITFFLSNTVYFLDIEQSLTNEAPADETYYD